MPLQIVRNDITKMKVDAIVNAAKNSLLGGGGVDGSIHRAAGPELLKECRTLGGCETGDAKITKGYRLPAKYVIHTVGPVWAGGDHGEREQLVSCYRKSLALAEETSCETVAFPLISSGIYGYPKDQALRVAVDTIGDFLMEHDMTVYLVIFDRKAYEIGSNLFRDIEEYIDDNYVDAHTDRAFESRRRRLAEDAVAYSRMPGDFQGMPQQAQAGKIEAAAAPQGSTAPWPDAAPQANTGSHASAGSKRKAARKSGAKLQQGIKPRKDRQEFFGIGRSADDNVSLPEEHPRGTTSGIRPKKTDAGNANLPETDVALPSSLDDAVREIDESFSEMLLRKIDEEGLTDAQVYKKANIDRKLFSKIRSDRLYRPSKPTVLAFAIALELPLEETKEMLMKAGFALSHAYKFDIIIEYFIQHGNYNIFEINEALFAFDQSLLGV